jgi:hypothetical protein
MGLLKAFAREVQSAKLGAVCKIRSAPVPGRSNVLYASGFKFSGTIGRKSVAAAGQPRSGNRLSGFQKNAW